MADSWGGGVSWGNEGGSYSSSAGGWGDSWGGYDSVDAQGTYAGIGGVGVSSAGYTSGFDSGYTGGYDSVAAQGTYAGIGGVGVSSAGYTPGDTETGGFDWGGAVKGAGVGMTIGGLFGLPGTIAGAMLGGILGGLGTEGLGVGGGDGGPAAPTAADYGGYEGGFGSTQVATPISKSTQTTVKPGTSTAPALAEDKLAGSKEEDIIRKKARQRMGFLAMRRFEGSFFNPFVFTPEAFAGSLKS
jgi:hypothetical protein